MNKQTTKKKSVSMHATAAWSVTLELEHTAGLGHRMGSQKKQNTRRAQVKNSCLVAQGW